MRRALHAREITAVATRAAAIADVAVAPDGARFAACFDRTLAVAEWASGAEVARREHAAVVEAIAFSPDGTCVAAACADGRIALHHIAAGREPRVLASANGRHGGFGELAWSNDGRRLAAGHWEPLVTVFDVAGTDPPIVLDAEIFSDEGRTAVAFSPDGGLLASTAFDTVVRWSLPALKRRKLALRAHAFVIDIAFSHGGHALAGIAETEGVMALHLWSGDGATRRGKVDLPAYSPRLAWSADDTLIAVIERDAPGLSLWDAESMARADVAVESVAMAMAALGAHPARLAFLAGSEHGELVVWETREPREAHEP